jgi:hypothetical protein
LRSKEKEIETVQLQNKAPNQAFDLREKTQNQENNNLAPDSISKPSSSGRSYEHAHESGSADVSYLSSRKIIVYILVQYIKIFLFDEEIH